MAAIFAPACILCLDECMSTWNLMFPCPGWVFVQENIIFGNEYYSMYCGITGVMIMIELVDGKDRCHALGNCKFDDCGGEHVDFLFRCWEIILQLEDMLSLIQDLVCLEEFLSWKRGNFCWSTDYEVTMLAGIGPCRSIWQISWWYGCCQWTDYFIQGMKELDYIMMIIMSSGS